MSRPQRRFLLNGILGLAALVGVAFLPATQAGAATASRAAAAAASAAAGWAAQQAAVPMTPNGALDAVACPSGSDCTAVGDAIGPAGNQVPIAAQWNGRTWKVQRLPVPTNGTANTLLAVSCPSASLCKAVGDYINAAGAQVTLAEAWDGTRWSLQPAKNPTGGAFDSLAGVSCPSAVSCTAVGDYTVANGDEVTLAESWNGTRWTVVNSANPGGAFDVLSAVSCPSATACTAVGQLLNASGAALTLGEVWNGHTWAVAATANKAKGRNDVLQGVSCTSATSCTAVGAYATAAGEQLPLAEARTGATWNVQATANPRGTGNSALNQVSCLSLSACTAVGFANTSAGDTPLAEYFNGSTWVVQKTVLAAENTGPDLYGVSCTAWGCLTVGHVTDAANDGVTLAEFRAQTTWVLQTTANVSGAQTSALFGDSCVSAAACTAVGERAGDTLAELWNGTSWVVQSTPNVAGADNSALHGVSCTSPTACIAVGEDTEADGQSVTLAQAWNGTKWTVQPTPDPTGVSFSSFNQISCVSADDCIAVGSSSVGTLAEQWNGTVWTAMTTTDPAEALDAQLFGVSCTSPTACTAVGGYVDSSGDQLSLAEQWNGTSWSATTTVNPAGSDFVTLAAVSCTTSFDCTAVGATYSDETGYTPLAEVSTGGAWTVQPTPTPTGAGSTRLSAVSCTSTCTAVGSSTDAAGEPVTLAEVRTGATWAVQTTADPTRGDGSVLNAVSCTAASVCRAAGTQANVSDLDTPYIESEQ